VSCRCSSIAAATTHWPIPAKARDDRDDGPQTDDAGRSGESVLVGVGDGLGPVANAGLGEEVVDVALDGGFADDQLAGDLGVR
jgi:hypothetical protein